MEAREVVGRLASQVDEIGQLIDRSRKRQSEYGESSQLERDQKALVAATEAGLLQVRGSLKQAIRAIERSCVRTHIHGVDGPRCP